MDSSFQLSNPEISAKHAATISNLTKVAFSNLIFQLSPQKHQRTNIQARQTLEVAGRAVVPGDQITLNTQFLFGGILYLCVSRNYITVISCYIWLNCKLYIIILL